MTASASGKAKKPTPRQSAAAAVDAQLKKLSVELEETSRSYVRRLQRELLDISRALPERRAKELAKVGKLIGSLHIKAQKGRRKDLKKIDLLIGEIQKVIEG